jgi:L-cystine transport system permease protein
MGKGNLLISRHLGNYSLETYTAVALVYWGIALIISLISRMIEKKLSIKAR